MVDPEISLTFSVRNNPGRMALLIGSGVSTGAGIPTGWSIVRDLISQLAALEGEEIDGKPEEWYKETYGEKATYDDVLEKVGPSMEDRRSILERYIEPTEEEKEREQKVPTSAHESIAWLVDKGYVNVIVTTNFDRLLEKALSRREVSPVVITNSDDAKGAEPLTHQDAVILKINGDYKERNIKNIGSELEAYDEPIQELISQVFREYGLIVCGWSGEWDTALRDTLKECEVHRYSTFWAYYSTLKEAARSLTAHRDAIDFRAGEADVFFTELKERVQALEGAESGAPLSREIARERTKRYLTREEHKIDLADLLNDEAKEVYSRIFDEERFPLGGSVAKGEDDSRLDEYESIIGTLLTASITCAFWSSEAANSAHQPISSVIQRIASLPNPSIRPSKLLNTLRLYPATALLYGIGVAAVASDDWELVKHALLDTRIQSRTQYGRITEPPAVNVLHPHEVAMGYPRPHGGKTKLRTRLEEFLRDPISEPLANPEQFRINFELFETVSDMILLQRRTGDQDPDIVDKSMSFAEPATGSAVSIDEKIESKGTSWGPIRVGLFESPESALQLVSRIEKLRF
ncbi:SIR2 family protein [Halogeometricum luteum]|uniref:SIR2 family protein n=1 Tax=Halogeometricum luteum TaxID=2950537 RepID=A0ABU2G6L6_9EURY|nr:SIR2 family protein [Halogeometricum sp. S3BR5-2]MDS0296431.1 SIR2 family protein [Halogeometricum sp. S3BR5-2]